MKEYGVQEVKWRVCPCYQRDHKVLYAMTSVPWRTEAEKEEEEKESLI